MTIFLASREAVAIKVPLSIKSRKMTKSSFRLLYLQSRTLLKFGQNVKKKKNKRPCWANYLSKDSGMFDQMVFESGRQVSFNFDEAVGKGFSSVFCRRANLMQSWLLVFGEVYWSTPNIKVEKTEK